MAIMSGSLLAEFVGVIFVILAGVYIYMRYIVFNYWKKRGVPYAEPTVPFGNFTSLIKIEETMGEAMQRLYASQSTKRYFGTFFMQIPHLVVADPDILRHVLTKNFEHFHDRGFHNNESVDPLSGQLFLLAGDKWRNIRAKLTPTYTSGKLKKMFTMITDCGEKLSAHLKPIAEKRGVIDAKDLFARFGTDVIMSTAFGIDSNSIDNPKSEFIYWGRRALTPSFWRSLLTMFAPAIMDFFSIPSNEPDVTNFFTKIFKDTMEHRESNGITRPDFMHLLIQLINKGYVEGELIEDKPSIAETSSGKITMMEAVAQSFVFFGAGFDTTSSAITFCLYELSLNQEIQDKVVEDINASIEKHGGLTYESLKEMPYLTKVVSETLRKYPPLPILNRQCNKDINLPMTDLHLSKGTNLVVPVLGMHRDPSNYPDPDKFNPERFNEDNIAARHPYTYLPFGEGPRACIGMRFAFAQTKVGLISILSKYRVTLAPNTRVPLELDPKSFILSVKGGLKLVIENR